MSKSSQTQRATRAFVTWKSPLGLLLLGADEAGLTDVQFWSGPAPSSRSQVPVLQQAQEELHEYFAGQRRVFDLPLSWHGTSFQKAAWAALCQIPWGSTWTYGQQAAAMGQASAVRAVGAANGRNPLAIIVPCHRVIGANGQLTGYAGGLQNKAALLALEGLNR